MTHPRAWRKEGGAFGQDACLFRIVGLGLMGFAVWAMLHSGGGPAAWVCLGGVFLLGLAVFEILGHTFLIAAVIVIVLSWWPWSRRDGFVTNYGAMMLTGAGLMAWGALMVPMCIQRGKWGGLVCSGLAFLFGLALFGSGEGFSYLADAGRWLVRVLGRRPKEPPGE